MLKCLAVLELNCYHHMLQEMAFRFTRISYNNLCSMTPDVASLTFPIALSSQ